MASGRRLLAVVLAAALVASACASSGQPARTTGKFTLFEEEYASWDHLKFSVKMTLRRLVGQPPLASPEDVKAAQAQGGWWGAEIPATPAP